MSWIHLDDIVGAFLTALDHPQASGPINGTAPEPLRNKAFSKCLAAALHRPCIFPIPGFALRLRFGEVADVIVGGQRVLPARLEQLGYEFRHPDVRRRPWPICSHDGRIVYLYGMRLSDGPRERRVQRWERGLRSFLKESAVSV